jgi:hypothetical protein
MDRSRSLVRPHVARQQSVVGRVVRSRFHAGLSVRPKHAMRCIVARAGGKASLATRSLGSAGSRPKDVMGRVCFQIQMT